jgi:hypothetical protein
MAEACLYPTASKFPFGPMDLFVIWPPVRGVQALSSDREQGEMAEWLKARAWKVRIPPKGIGGSNPSLSAKSCER